MTHYKTVIFIMLFYMYWWQVYPLQNPQDLVQQGTTCRFNPGRVTDTGNFACWPVVRIPQPRYMDYILSGYANTPLLSSFLSLSIIPGFFFYFTLLSLSLLFHARHVVIYNPVFIFLIHPPLTPNAAAASLLWRAVHQSRPFNRLYRCTVREGGGMLIQ